VAGGQLAKRWRCPVIRAASRRAMAELHAHLDTETAHLGSAELAELAEQLYAVAGLLFEAPRLRRIVGDPSTSEESRTQLVSRLLGDKVAAATLSVVKAATAMRWSSPWDLTDGLDQSGDEVLLRTAELGGVLDEVEDQLFRFERILDSQAQLVTLLDEVSVPAERRTALLRDVVFGRVHPITQRLLEHAVTSPRKRSVEGAIDDLLQTAAARRERSVARVLSAVPVTASQEQRLARALSGIYGRPIAVRTAVDPSVQGGLVIRIGDELIDGSVAGRFTTARAALVGH
jgi:F-type H+-transporting ATPase subunit delta